MVENEQDEVLGKFADIIEARRLEVLEQLLDIERKQLPPHLCEDEEGLRMMTEVILEHILANLRGRPLHDIFDQMSGIVSEKATTKLGTEDLAALIDRWRALLINVFREEVNGPEQMMIAERHLHHVSEKTILWWTIELSSKFERTVERKGRETEALQSTYEELLFNANDLIFSLDEQARIVFVNMKGLEILGLQVDDVLGREFTGLLASVHKDFAAQQIIRSLDGMSTTPFEVEFRRADGSIVPFELNLSPAVGGAEERRSWGIARDLTQRKKIEKGIISYSKELERTVEKKTRSMRMKDSYMAKVLNSSNEAIITIDLDSNITTWNRGAELIFGYKAEDVLGKPYRVLVPSDLEIEFEEILNEVLKRGFIRNYETERLTSDGRRIIVSTTVNAIEDQSGDLSGFVGVLRDVTRSKKMEQDLVHSKAELEKAYEELRRHNIQLEKDNIRLRDLLSIRPVKEVETDVEESLELRKGHIYLVKSDDMTSSMRVFADGVRRGMHGLCITREPPYRVRERWGLQKTPMVWLTTNRLSDEHCISPSGIGELSSSIVAFLEKAQNGIIILTGLEYLISQNSFRPILNLVQLLNDKIMVSDARLVATIDPLSIDDRDLHMLQKETIDLGPDGPGADTDKRYIHLTERFDYEPLVPKIPDKKEE